MVLMHLNMHAQERKIGTGTFFSFNRVLLEFGKAMAILGYFLALSFSWGGGLALSEFLGGWPLNVWVCAIAWRAGGKGKMQYVMCVCMVKVALLVCMIYVYVYIYTLFSCLFFQGWYLTSSAWHETGVHASSR